MNNQNLYKKARRHRADRLYISFLLATKYAGKLMYLVNMIKKGVLFKPKTTGQLGREGWGGGGFDLPPPVVFRNMYFLKRG